MTTMQTVYYSTYEGFPVGNLHIASTDWGICACLSASEPAGLVQWLEKHFPVEQIRQDQERNREIEQQLREYFAGERRQFELACDLRGTEFQVRVWQELQKIPYGQTITYGELARRVGGGPNYSRAVGGANNKNPIGIIVPCHRVIGHNGQLVGYAGGLDMKRKLLQLEMGGLFPLEKQIASHC